jgi:hypothetical protein
MRSSGTVESLDAVGETLLETDDEGPAGPKRPQDARCRPCLKLSAEVGEHEVPAENEIDRAVRERLTDVLDKLVPIRYSASYHTPARTNAAPSHEGGTSLRLLLE